MWGETMKTKMLIVAALAATTLPLVGCGEIEPKRGTLVAMAVTGEARVKPDLAEVTGGIESRAATAREALDQQSRKMTAITAAIAAAGVKPDDIETAQITLNPVQAWTKSGPKVTGYVATNIVTIKLRNLDKVGVALDAIVSDGGNRIDGVVFKQDSLDAAEAAARADAIAKAKARIDAYAKASGLKVHKIISIIEDGAAIDQPGQGLVLTEAAAAPVAPPVVQRAMAPSAPGVVEAYVRLQVTYELRP
jgi:uncharacterized protein